MLSSEEVKKKKKKLFWVTRYSLGKTFSKELLIEHEFANDETRHRLIEVHTNNDQDKKHYLFLAIVALLLNPPIGFIACILICLSKRRSTDLMMNNENLQEERADVRYAFVSYILSILSIGLTISFITGVLLYFFIRDVKLMNRSQVISSSSWPSETEELVDELRETSEDNRS